MERGCSLVYDTFPYFLKIYCIVLKKHILFPQLYLLTNGYERYAEFYYHGRVGLGQKRLREIKYGEIGPHVLGKGTSETLGPSTVYCRRKRCKPYQKQTNKHTNQWQSADYIII